jgi:hypothetical protein
MTGRGGGAEWYEEWLRVLLVGMLAELGKSAALQEGAVQQHDGMSVSQDAVTRMSPRCVSQSVSHL